MAVSGFDGSIGHVAHIHPPKIEYFDLDAKSNTDPKGLLRSVDEYRLTPTGLYMFRPLAGHPKISHFESWFVPKLNVRVTRQSWHPGHELDFDFYVDVVEITSVGSVWKTTDLYLDLIVRTVLQGHAEEADPLSRAHPNAKVLYLSPADSQPSRPHLPGRVLPTPISPEHLLSTVRELLGRQ